MQYLQYSQTRIDAMRIAIKAFCIALPLAILITSIAWAIAGSPIAILIAAFAWGIGIAVGFARPSDSPMRVVNLVLKTICVALITTFVGWILATTAFANPYLTMDAARNQALNHVWYYHCDGYTHCYQYPSLAGGSYRMTDTKVAVNVIEYNRSGACQGRLYVRSLEGGGAKVYWESLWVC